MGGAASGPPLTPSLTPAQRPGNTGGRECPPFCLSVPHSDSCAPGTRARCPLSQTVSIHSAVLPAPWVSHRAHQGAVGQRAHSGASPTKSHSSGEQSWDFQPGSWGSGGASVRAGVGSTAS